MNSEKDERAFKQNKQAAVLPFGLLQLALLSLLACAIVAQGAATAPLAELSRTNQLWGYSVQGLSVRLSATKPIWDFRESRFFSFSVRNQGDEVLDVVRSQISGELEVDGIWYKWYSPVIATATPLNPGSSFENIPIVIGNGSWRKDLTLSMPRPGRHTLRFAVFARTKNGGDTVRAMSNPLEIDCQWGAASTNPPVKLIKPDAPVIADLQGRVLDDATGNLVTNFQVQEGCVSPENPDEIIWSRTFTGPDLNRPGWFGVQGRKQGECWRVLADGYVPERVTKEPVATPITTFDMVVRLKRGGELRGVVKDYLGHPLTGARIFLNTEPNLTYKDGTLSFRGSSATSDTHGAFILQGVGQGEPQLVTVSADGFQICSGPRVVSGKDLSIIFAKPASLLVKYDIPGDQSTAELKLSLRTSELPGWDLGSGEFSTTVTNGGQVLLNLSPGTYDFYRFKNLKADDAERGIPFERRTVLLESGQTQEISLVRSVGSRVQGRIKDIDQTPAKSGYLYVRSAIATGEPRNHTEWLLPSFDALTFGSDGVFQTAQLEPGDYTLIAHVYTPEPPQLRYNTGIRLPAYWGTAKVRVAALVTPVSVEIDLRPTNTR